MWYSNFSQDIRAGHISLTNKTSTAYEIGTFGFHAKV